MKLETSVVYTVSIYYLYVWSYLLTLSSQRIKVQGNIKSDPSSLEEDVVGVSCPHLR
jgi:hypothetical protein